MVTSVIFTPPGMYCVPVAVSIETELGLDDGKGVPSMTMVVLSEVMLLFVAVVSSTRLELVEEMLAFIMIVSFETKLELSMASFGAVSVFES
mmetsp:Transcript_22557/g.33730  ORF Transcript_22557/g.33730 Transcript_22557/m.33730 type:complete len:92 (-) Transcript_22557:624-899(-)